jgi:hypothetical protein
MTEQETLIQEIRECLSGLKGTGSIDSMAVASKLGTSYSMTEDEIIALVQKEADALGVNYVTRSK